MEQCLMGKEDLREIMREIFKREYQINSITRIPGGAQKGTYKVECSEQFSCVLYIWDESLSYFKSVHTKEAFISNSAYLFEKNYDLLTSYNIRVPKIYHIDLSKTKFPFEYALAQYIEGGELESLMHTSQVDIPLIMRDLKDNIRKLHSIKSSRVGDLKYTRGEDFSCKEYTKQSLDKALMYLFQNYEPVSKLKRELIDISNQLYNHIKERKDYSLIHFELGPNHVMVDKEGKTYLIDFEGMKYFDLEYEYSFLKLRYGKYYPSLRSMPVDNHRIKYYLLHHHIMAIEGAHQLITKDYYDLADAREMIEYNYGAILRNYIN